MAQSRRSYDQNKGERFWDQTSAKSATQTSSQPKKNTQWYVLQAPDGRCVGQQWSSSFRGARTSLVSLQEASVLHPKWIAETRQRAMEALGIQTVPRPIRIDGSGHDSKIAIVTREDTE